MPTADHQQFSALVSKMCDRLLDDGWQVLERRSIDYGVSLVLAGGGMVNLYNGKKGPSAVLAGKLTTDEKARLARLIDDILPARDKKSALSNAAPAAVNKFASTSPWIGCDESGKGDYFGPLVVAAVLVRPDQVEALQQAGLRDSKRVSDRKALELSSWIEQHCPTALRLLMPPDYNRRYGGNLNVMLSELHAETIGELAHNHQASRAVSDQFGNPALLRRLLKGHESLELISIPKAEEDLAVAAASIVARAHFLEGLRQLSRDATLELPPGAGPQVEAAARTLVRLFGAEQLGAYAKLHFKTTQRIVGQAEKRT